MTKPYDINIVQGDTHLCISKVSLNMVEKYKCVATKLIETSNNTYTPYGNEIAETFQTLIGS